MENTNLYTVLLVDDEEEVTEVIRSRIDWEGLGFTVVGSASNGVKAYELAQEYQPDVVMTDIKMPYMDGLELTRRLKREFSAMRILLFTGFDEFEYAKEAVHLEVEEYLLKPLNLAELTDVFRRLKESLDQEREERRSVERLQNYYLESLPLLQTNFYISLIEGRTRPEYLQRFIENYHIELKGPLYAIVVFQTSNYQERHEINPLLIAMSIQQQAEAHLQERWGGPCFSYLENVVMIAQMQNAAEATELTDECERFCRAQQRILGTEITAGIGKVCDNLLGFEESYAGAREAVSYRVLYGAGHAINIHEIAPTEAAGYETTDDENLRNLFKGIHICYEGDISRAIEAYIKDLAANARTPRQYEIAVMDLVSNIYRFASANHINPDTIRGGGENLYERVPRMDIEALRTWLYDIAHAFSEILTNVRSNTSKSYVEEAQDYVRNHYDDAGLSLDAVCGSLGVSNSYFSSVFKRETGESFISYLTNYRMQEAARLLLTTDSKNYEIASRVGYEDANYFSYVFKKAYGVSPSKYRSENQNA